MAATQMPTLPVTLHLPKDVYDTAQEAVALGLASSQSSFIEEAIRLRMREVRHARKRKLASEAMADPDFVADRDETMQAFRHVDKENWPLYDEESASCPVHAAVSS